MDDLNTGGTRRTYLNPKRSEPATYYDRSVDTNPTGGSPGGGGTTDTDWPLKLVKVDDTHVKVTLGTISGFVPTDVDTDLDVSGTDGTWVFYFHVTISGKSVTSAELVQDPSGGAVPTDDGNNSYRLVGRCVVDSGVIASVTNGFGWSQSVVTCTDDSTPHIWETGA